MTSRISGLFLKSISPMIFKHPHACLFLCLVLIQLNCKKDEAVLGDTWSGGKVMILGHAGMGIAFNMPINSLESIRTAIETGCDGSEIDVQMTRDSVLVAYHDHDLSSLTSCKGALIDHLWSGIRGCRYNIAARPATLCTVDQLFSGIGNATDLYFSFDCKFNYSGMNRDEFEYIFLRAIQRIGIQYGMEGHILIEGHAGFLEKAKNMGMPNRLFLYSNNDDDPVNLARQKFAGISTVTEISGEDIKKAYEAGLMTMVWDPDNYYENKATLEKKPDIIQTDDPISILKLLKRYNYENVTP
jgi:glycerophosphoryl diester phosphodiesterase